LEWNEEGIIKRNSGYDNKQTTSANMLWKTNLSSCGNSSDFRNVLPYMAYAAWGNMGKSSSNKEYTTFIGDYFFQCWKQGIFFNDNVTTFPEYVSSNTTNSGFAIAIVEKKHDETIIVMRKYGCRTGYNIQPTMCIECNGQKYYIRSVDYYELGKRIYSECGTRYFRMHFPSIPSNAHIINIREDKVKNGFEWIGLSIN
jgi:hypothetical protein